ncbi:DEAD/DEAH box helicase [Burkholderiaceae bacterium DAT-1]|nr:DEAD/DEAH box helicase [Burkholderiaceae bacterium DAT-1]
MLPYKEADITRFFDDTTVARGRRAYVQGHAQSVVFTEDDARIDASVEEGDGPPVEVRVHVMPGPRNTALFQSRCGCSEGKDCKHVVATLLQALEEDAGTEEVAEAAPAAGKVVPNWLAGLVPGNAPVARKTSSAMAIHKLFYVVRDEPGVVHLSLHQARPLKRGGYGAPTPFKPEKRGESEWLEPIDHELLDALATLTPVHESEFLIPKETGLELLRKLVATERCHWLDLTDGALQFSRGRDAKLVWQIDAQARQKPELIVEPEVDCILAIDPLYYIEGTELGELKIDLPPADLLSTLAMRAVEPDLVQGVRDSLPTHVPKPALLEEGGHMQLVPRGRLHFVSMPSWELSTWVTPEWARDAMLDLVVFGVDYDGLAIKPSDKRPTLTRWQDEKVWRIDRDLVTESIITERFSQLGLIALNELEPAFGPDARGYYTISPGSKRKGHNGDGWNRLVEDSLPALRREGWIVDFEADFHYGFIEPESWHIDIQDSTGLDWFGLTLEVDINGERRPLLPILINLIAEYPTPESLPKEGRVRVKTDRGEVLGLPIARIRPMVETLWDLFNGSNHDGRTLKLGRYDAARLAELSGIPELTDVQWHGADHWRDLGMKLANLGGLKETATPAGLKATLRPYQQQGLSWMQTLAEAGFGGVLADDMGLGKTVQTLSHLVAEKESGMMDGPCMIVAPTSLVHNWKRESERFAPGLKVTVLHGPDRHNMYRYVAGSDLVITTYPLLGRDQEFLQKQKWHLLVLDEAQQIKNPKSQAAQAVRALETKHRLCLTGTPMENHLGELWSLFDFLLPGWLGDEKGFRKQWRSPIEKHGNMDRRNLLSRRIAPFLLRRTKEQVATELPPKTETIQYVELEGPQRDLYETVRLTMDARVREEIARRGAGQSQIVILDALLKLRQVCCDPRLVKADSARALPSAKLEALIEMVTELAEEGRRILVFSQFTSMLTLISNELKKQKIDYVILTGDTADRATPVERFQAGNVPVFLISLKAGGVGLNLTAADTVIHFDPWWNPAAENQATDRAYRIGQDKPVFVYKLVAKGTVEERIIELQRRKAELAAGVLGEEGAALTALSTDELVKLFAPIE